MKLSLQQLKLSNFKGIKSLTLELNGSDANIYGTNATGKTTIYDAFLWLLFDKDSQNRSNFNIKTLDESGEPIHGLDHEVEAVLFIDDRKVTLKKSFKEKWTKKRGSATAEFTGHTTDYFVDGVPVKKGEYDDAITSIADEDTFKLLTSPAYFNEVMRWQDRRSLLLDVCGDINDADVIASDKALSRLPDILQGRSIEEHQKVIKAKRKEINQELERIPVRIDEVMRGLPDMLETDIDGISAAVEAAAFAIGQKEEEINVLQMGNGIAAKAQELERVEADIRKVQTEATQKMERRAAKIRAELSAVRDALQENEFAIGEAKRNINEERGRIKRLDAEIKQLREEWHKVNSQQWTGDEACPTCGQALPDDQIDESRANFNRLKAEKLEQINVQGRKARDSHLESSGLLQKDEDHLATLEDNRNKLKEQENTLKTELGGLDTVDVVVPYYEIPGVSDQMEQKKRLQDEIEFIKTGSAEAVAKALEELDKLRSIYDAHNAEKTKAQQYLQGQKRITELKDQERKLAAEFEQLEHELYLMEQFIRAKVSLLEDKINRKFEMARFKLFNVLVNGAVEECCETIYKGIPYSSDLNNAAKINVGLDIIRTLSEHYKFTPPIFVDNAEAVVDLLPINTQVVRLVVSGEHRQLHIEVQEKQSIEEAV